MNSLDELAVPPEAADLRPLAKHIYHVLASDGVGAMSRDDIATSLCYSERAVGNACNDLVVVGLLRKRLHPTDGRKRLYDPADPDRRD